MVTPHPPSFQDFVVGLSILLRGTVQEKLKWAFNLYDINKDGYITKEVRGTEAQPVCPLLHSCCLGCPAFSPLPIQKPGGGQLPEASLLLGCPGPLSAGSIRLCASHYTSGFSSASVLEPSLLTESHGKTQVEKPRMGLALAPTNQGETEWGGESSPHGTTVEFFRPKRFLYVK